MCTAITFRSKDHYFGRNLDLEFGYKESVTVTPRNYPLVFRSEPEQRNHFAFIGMATMAGDYPLYYEATNECGLSVAGLNFPGNATYHPKLPSMTNLAPYELIPWLLGQCESVSQVKEQLKQVNLWSEPFSSEYPLTPLHWLIADSSESITAEPLADGLKLYENQVGVLTNNPPFDYHMHNLTNYLNLTREQPANSFLSQTGLVPNSCGTGAMGLPGDYSSASRFIKATFVKLNSLPEELEEDSVTQFFHILGSVAQQKGCVKTAHGLERTMYTCCCNTDRGIYYYNTYNNSQISAVSLHHVDICGTVPISYPLVSTQQIRWIN